MRIRCIEVTDLFGVFNHTVPLNMEERVTVMHGPNGFGKTILLRFVHGLFTRQFEVFRGIPFSLFAVEFDDGARLTVRKETSRKSRERRGEQQLLFTLNKGKQQPQVFPEPIGESESRFAGLPLGLVEHELPELERVAFSRWVHRPTREVLDLDAVFERFGDRLPARWPRRKSSWPAWLQRYLSVPVHLVEAQRLVRFREDHPQRGPGRRPLVREVVESYAEELAQLMRDALTAYAALSQSLDRTFPRRLVGHDSALDLTSDELRARLAGIEQERSRLIEVGLLEQEQETAFSVGDEIDDATRSVLSVYVQDVEQKLAELGALARKIELLTEVINQHFQYKKIATHRDRGIYFNTSDESTLSPKDLSSGEQHELVLAYELLFKVKEDALVLIDEPELSLHVAWQIRFLKDLQAMIQLSSFDALVATHSPQIIHDRWDLTVELQGPEDEGAR